MISEIGGHKITFESSDRVSVGDIGVITHLFNDGWHSRSIFTPSKKLQELGMEKIESIAPSSKTRAMKRLIRKAINISERIQLNA